jgi:chemotaxis response regulator CheB
MRDNVGIAELSSPMLRDLLRDACAGVGRVSVYPRLEDVRSALLLNPPKILVLGGAPLDPALLTLLKRIVSTHGVIGLAVADDHDLQLAMNAGAVEGFARTPDGLRQLAMRLRPMLAPSLRPPPSQASVTLSSSAPPARNSADAKADKRSLPAGSDDKCALIALGSFAARGDAVAYLLSRLPNNLPGIVLVHGHIQPDSDLKQLLIEESSWRVYEAGEPGVVSPGSIWIAHRATPWQLRSTPAGVELARKPLAANSGRKSLPPAGTDTFLEAVGQSLGARALGVLLGATGDEGSYGLWAVRNAGSYTMSQRDPGGAAHDHTSGASHSQVAHEALGLERLPQAITAYCQGQNSYRSLRHHHT